VRGGTTRLESLTLRLLDPDRLPEGYELLAPRATREDAVRGSRPPATRSRGAWAPLEEHVSLVAFPLILVPFTPPDGGEAHVAVDALTGRVIGEAPPWTHGGRESEPRPVCERPRIVPLECGECGWDLTPRERDRLHPCPHCQATWEITGGERRRVRQWVLEGEPGEGGLWLPFWVFGEGATETAPPPGPAFAPAYAARHPEDQVHLAARLTETSPSGEWGPPGPWPRPGAAVGSAEAAGWLWGVEGARSRSSLAAFARFLKGERRQKSTSPQGIVWIPFRRSGGDLVEPRTGARVRLQGTAPWRTRRAA
jgi:hypothetical protein